MVDDGGIKVMSTLTVNYKPAIDATKQLAEITAQLDHQLRNFRITATSVGQGVGAGFYQPIQQGQVILDRHGKVLVDVGKKAEVLTEQHKTYDSKLKQHTQNVHQAAEAYGVLGSQWERRVSWFIAGVGFYGFIRSMRQAIDTMRQIEMDMVAIQRTTDDVTFNFKEMRDELQNLGMAYGHTWETVSDIALRWTQAGYNVQDTLEQTRVGLLALNVAEMDARMVSEGMIAIMAQWGFTARDLETVIDKLDVTADNFAVTTGDLVEALVRSSGAARAVHMTFEDTLGVITAMRVATGRTGREVGNAANTIFSFITRQMTLNKLMESGIDVFADAANTKLRPVMDILNDIYRRWGDNVEEMPEQLIEIAEQMGLMSEEIAESVDLQQEWTDLQKIDIETSAAGVRRRSFFIALLRNFAQVQEVVNNLYDVEGYSMRQNILTMETLEKRQEQLRVSIEKLAITMGEAGLLEQIKGIVDGATNMVEWFNNLDSTAQTLIITFAQLVLGLKLVETTLKMTGYYTSTLSVLSTQAATAQAAYAVAAKKAAVASGAAAAAAAANAAALQAEAAAATAAATAWRIKTAAMTMGLSLLIAGIVTYVIQNRKANEELKVYTETLSAVAEEQNRLDRMLERSVKGSVEHNLALEQKREMIDSIVQRYPGLIEGYDRENDMYILNAEMLAEATRAVEEQREGVEGYIEISRELYDAKVRESKQYEDSADRLERLFVQRESLIKSLEDEAKTSEEYAKKKEKIKYTDEAIIRIIGDYNDAIRTSADITKTSIDAMIRKFREKADEAEGASRRVIAASEKEAIAMMATLRGERAMEEMQLIRLQQERGKIVEDLYPALKEALKPYSWQEMADAPYIYDPEQAVKESRAIAALDDRIAESRDRINKYRQEIGLLEDYLKELNESMIDLADETDDSSKKAGDSKRSLTDIINAYIAATMRASEVQGMMNSEMQRTIDGLRAKITYYSRDTATAWERSEALRSEAELLEILQKKQEGVHQEANFLRAALAQLEKRQAGLNLSTDEGRDAYSQLEDQIERIKDALSRLGVEWFKLQEAQEVGISNLERIRSLRESEIADLERSIDYLTREGATASEVAQADHYRLRLIELLNEKIAENNNKIAEQRKYIEDARGALERDAITQEQYNEVIAESTKIIAELTGEIFDYKVSIEEATAANYANERSLKRVEETYKNALSSLDYFSRLGVYTVEQYLQKTTELYDRYGELTVEQEMEKYSRLASSYKDMLLEMKSDAEDAYRERIALIEKETEEHIALIQKQLDALDDEATLEDREEARRLHEQKIQDLLEQRRYHELRTGIEHERSIVDIDRQLSEEERQWQLRQSEWERQDRRDALNKQIEDIRESSKRQQEEWQKAYERMQADFDDHTISLLALAAAYDPDFWEDAKRKGELWIEGFRAGLPPDTVGNYLGTILGPAEDRIGRLHDDIYSALPHYPVTEEPPQYQPPDTTPPPAQTEPPKQSFPEKYVIDHPWGHTYTVMSGGHLIYKDGRYVPAENFKYLPEDILQLARDMKAGKAHTGAETLTYGIAELKPGELIFPPNLSVQIKRLIEVLTVRPLQLSGVSSGRINNFYAPLFNVEEQKIGDEVDAEIAFRELKRQIDLL